MTCRYFVAVKPSKNIRISINQILPNILSENDLNHLIDESKLKIKNMLSEVRKDNSPKSEGFKEFVYN